MSFEERITELNKWITESKHIVFFTGAGISTSSGIPDFRSEDGLYNKAVEINGIEYEPEFMLSIECSENFPDEFFQYLNHKMYYPDAKPNIAHQRIAELQKDHIVSVITQNIDGLHQAAGSEVVYELHGSFDRAYCQDCIKYYPGDIVFQDVAPRCECGGIIVPDIVLYGQGLPTSAFNPAIAATSAADLFIIVGSSMSVMPAGMIPSYYKGKRMVVINRDSTQWDAYSLVFREDIKDVFERIKI